MRARARKFNNFDVYSEAKVANILYAMELAERLEGTGVTTASVHPGWARSNFGKSVGRLYRILVAIMGARATGANTSLGFEASKEVARKGAKVIMACSNMDKAQTALTQITEDTPNASVGLIQLDLASLKSIHQFADKFKTKYNRLDVQLNNAGIMFAPYRNTEDGFEQTFGIDHARA